MMSEHASPKLPDFGMSLSIPERDPDGVNLSILGLNEVVGPKENGGIRAVTGEIIDLAARGYLQVRDVAAKGDEPNFLLRRREPLQSNDLLPEEQELLSLCFDINAKGEEGEVHMAELAANPDLTADIEILRKGLRRRLTQGMGPERYMGMSPEILRKIRKPLIAMGLGMVGVAFYINEPAIGVLGATLTAIETFDFVPEILEKTGRQMLGEVAMIGFEKFLDAAKVHIVNFPTILSILKNNENRAALAPIRANPDVLLMYERALGFLKILKDENMARVWTMELANLYDTMPVWFIAHDYEGQYDPDKFALTLRSFIDSMDALLLHKPEKT